MLQGAVVMMIIGITVKGMYSINSTTFFANSIFKDMVLKALIFLFVCAFLLIPINLSKKNLILYIEYLCKNKQYTFFKVDTIIILIYNYYRNEGYYGNFKSKCSC